MVRNAKEGKMKRREVTPLSALVLLLLHQPLLAASREYKFRCESVRTVSGLPEVKMSGTTKTRDPLPGEFLCNEAVTAPKTQHFDKLRSADVFVEYLRADTKGYTKVRLNGPMRFGGCDANPVPGATGELALGHFGAILHAINCAAPETCGKFGVIDQSRPEFQIAEISWGANYFRDSDGKVRGNTGGVGLIFQDSEGKGEPFQWNFGMAKCEVLEQREQE